MFYSKANLKSNGNQDSLCIIPFQIGNMSDNRMPARTLLQVFSFTCLLLSSARWDYQTQCEYYARFLS